MNKRSKIITVSCLLMLFLVFYVVINNTEKVEQGVSVRVDSIIKSKSDNFSITLINKYSESIVFEAESQIFEGKIIFIFMDGKSEIFYHKNYLDLVATSIISFPEIRLPKGGEFSWSVNFRDLATKEGGLFVSNKDDIAYVFAEVSISYYKENSGFPEKRYSNCDSIVSKSID